jgi:phosphatidylserine decarboxylase
MPELEKPDSPLATTNTKWRFPSVHPEGRKFLLIAAVATLVVYAGVSHFLGWLCAGLTIWVAAFFRDPIRTTPNGGSLVVAPADGLITAISKVPPPRELAGAGGLTDAEMTRVSIFMSVFDVHINRSPISGRVVKMAYVAGKFVNADLDKASEDNERQHFLIEGDGFSIATTQIAGLVARRILTFVREGDQVEAGQRIGMIRFGSRVDVYLPAGTGPRVLLGQRAIAGETVLAEIGIEPALTGTSQ